MRLTNHYLGDAQKFWSPRIMVLTPRLRKDHLDMFTIILGLKRKFLNLRDKKNLTQILGKNTYFCQNSLLYTITLSNP